MRDPRDPSAADRTAGAAQRALWFEPIVVAPEQDSGFPVPREIPLSPPGSIEEPPSLPRERFEVRWQDIKWVEPGFAAGPGEAAPERGIVGFEPVEATGPAPDIIGFAPPGAAEDAETAAEEPRIAAAQSSQPASQPGPLAWLGLGDAATPGPTRARRWARAARVVAAIIAAAILAAALGFGIAKLAGMPGAAMQVRHAPPTLGRASPRLPEPAGPPGDPARRVAYFLARARAGDPLAQQDLGALYAEGNGVARDYARAARWFRTAALAGVRRAQYDLGVLYAEGLGVPRDAGEAVVWYRRAADRDEPAAQYDLALAYAMGLGTPQDFVQAAGWYQRAAEQGILPAMVNFAILYEHGEGVEASRANAYAWYRAAAERGDRIAKERSAALFAQFPAAEKRRAQALAARVAASLHGPLPAPATFGRAESGPAPVLKPGGLLLPAAPQQAAGDAGAARRPPE